MMVSLVFLWGGVPVSCLFCNIVAGEIPAEIVTSDDDVVAFRDINPQAPTHVLVVPRDHYATAAEAGAADRGVMDAIARMAGRVAELDGVADDGYRLVFNTGSGAGQQVFHVHGHVLGGRALTWPPG